MKKIPKMSVIFLSSVLPFMSLNTFASVQTCHPIFDGAIDEENFIQDVRGFFVDFFQDKKIRLNVEDINEFIQQTSSVSYDLVKMEKAQSKMGISELQKLFVSTRIETILALNKFLNLPNTKNIKISILRAQVLELRQRLTDIRKPIEMLRASMDTLAENQLNLGSLTKLEFLKKLDALDGALLKILKNLQTLLTSPVLAEHNFKFHRPN